MCFRSIVATLALLVSAASPAKSNEEITIAHWGQGPILIYLPVYVARDAGFLDQEGLDCVFKFSGGDDQVFAAVLAGEAHVALGDPIFAAIARQRGGGGKVIASVVNAVANWVVAKQGTELPNGVRDLNNKRITAFPSPSTTFTVLSDIRNTYKLSEMTIVELAFGSELAALEQGVADLAVTVEPQVSIAVEQGYSVVFSLAEFYGPFSFTGITTTEEVLSQHEPKIQRFVNALVRAHLLIHTDVDRTIEIASENFPQLPPKVVAQAVRRLVADGSFPIVPATTSVGWNKAVAIRQQQGQITDVATVNAAVDNRYVLRALSVQDQAPNAKTVTRPDPAIELPSTSTAWRIIGILGDLSSISAILLVIVGYVVWWLVWCSVSTSFSDDETRMIGAIATWWTRTRTTFDMIAACTAVNEAHPNTYTNEAVQSLLDKMVTSQLLVRHGSAYRVRRIFRFIPLLKFLEPST